MHLNSTFQIALLEQPPRRSTPLTGSRLEGVTSSRHTLVGLASQ